MAVITALRPARRRTGAIEVEIDGTPLGPLSEREVAARGLAVGQTLDAVALADLEHAIQLVGALSVSNGFLAHRPRTAAEVRRRLHQAGYGEETISRALEALTQQGLLNDQRFAELWVESRSAFSPRSPRALQQELRRKGVDRQSIEQALAGAQSETGTLAVEAGRRRLRAFATGDEETFRKRMGGYLARRGFDYETVNTALETLWAEVREGL